MSIAEILTWNSVGRGKLSALIDFLISLSAPEAPLVTGIQDASPDIEHGASKDLLDAIRSIAAWGAATGRASLLESIATLTEVNHGPQDAAEVLRRMDQTELGGDLVEWWDPVASGAQLLANLDDREISILTSRTLRDTMGTERTLGDLANLHGITRERVRQIEKHAEHRLRTLASSDRYRSVLSAAHALRSELGMACPIDEANRLVHNNPESHVDELLLWLAGPYLRSDGWIVAKKYQSVSDFVCSVFKEISCANAIDRDSFVEALSEAGLNRRYFDRAIDATDRMTDFDDQIVLWPRGAGARAHAILSVRGVPMTARDLLEADPFAGSPGSHRNTLVSSGAIRRVGKDLWGLAEWDVEEYPGVAAAMVAEIEASPGPVEVDDLAQRLADKFGVAAASIRMNASMHPAFVREGSRVALRPDDQPYIPRTELIDTAHCFVVRGSWAYAIKVTSDTLRGSGVAIPEAFASHLGLKPLTRGTLNGPHRYISLSWNQYPAIGSIRANLEPLDAHEGDVVFIARKSGTNLGFALLRSSVLDSATPTARARLLMGADETDDRPVEVVAAEALGMGLASVPSSASMTARLRSRGDTEIANLIVHAGEKLILDRSRLVR